MKALKIAGAAIVAVIVVIALLLVIGIPSGFVTAQIQERVERETGYKLAINGGAKVGLWPQLNIRLYDVTLENPRERDINRRFAASVIEADVTLASLWAGKPEITDLVIIRPVVNLPLQRERARDATPAAKPASGKSADAFSIEHVSVTGGTIVLSNVRDRVERRIETVNADITIDADRKVVVTGSGRSSSSPLKFEVKAALPASLVERQNIPAEIKIDAPDLLPAQLTAKAEARLNGSVVMINSVTGALGDGAFNGWASVDLSSKPLVKLDLDFQRLTVAMSRSTDSSSAQPWSSATIDVNGLNYVDLQARISAAELRIGDARFTPAAIDANLTSGILKAQVSNLGAYEGTASGDLTADVSTANPTYAMRADLTGVRALPLLSGLADFDKLDGKMQAKINVRSSGTSQRAIMSNMAGTAFVVFQDGAIKGLNVAQMIRSLTASTLSGWQESADKATDLSQLSASFKIDKGQAQTTDLNLVGPLVKMTGVGTIDLGTKQIGFRVEPKLVMTTEGQGRAGDPVGFGIPVMIEGPWGSPRIYPELQGILDNPEAGYAKLKEMGKGLFGPNGAGLGAAIGNLLGGQPGTAGGQGNAPGTGKPNEPLGGQLGETIGNLIQQGLSGLGQGQGQGGARPGGQRSLTPTSPAEAPTQATPTPAEPAAPAPPSDTTAQQDSQPMNEVLRQLFNR
ncbi:cell envelope biogenesis protein AsmA [Bradyrhizobium lablabi]|uniref:Cell envelope biogenesis protein AsmA n=1 Tax=Bradyrhizobium lablabi TaxID=722472 RepID=A0A0R3MJQ8_9BRAD|nr:AsmA family protein [Bradyrhizobium lablabi]KRR20530.1 cell envelope biogenesis protein AsmA [Bradyrhizobium lablabi]